MTSVLLSLALGLALPCQQPKASEFHPLPEPTRFDAHFVEILGASQAAMTRPEFLEVEVRTQTKIESPEGSTESSKRDAIRAHRPDRVAIESATRVGDDREETQVLRAVCDGKSLITLHPPTGLYSLYDGPRPAGQIPGNLLIALSLEGSGIEVLTRPDMRDFILRQASAARRIGAERIGNVDTEHFRIRWLDQDVDLWIGPADQPLLRKLLQRRRVALPSAKAGQNQTMTIERQALLSWSIGQPIPDAVFTLTLPTDARQVKDVGQALIAPQTHAVDPRKPGGGNAEERR